MATLIVGLGRTGLSVARFLTRHGVPFRIADSRSDPPGLSELREIAPDARPVLGSFDADLFRSAGQVIVSPGVSLAEPAIGAAIDAGREVIGDVELFARLARAPVVAVTGSNGKSTVTTLVGEMADAAGRRVRVGGNLGTPVLDLLGANEPDLYVLELSSFQLETIAHLAPAAAVVLNVSPDHMDRYPDLAAYAAAKGRIYRNARVCVVNRDDEPAGRYARGFEGHEVTFGAGEPESPVQYGLVDADGETWLAHGTSKLMSVRELRIAGRHNAINALAALALGEAVGLPLSAMLETLREFPGLPHRTRWIADIRGVSWYDDSKGTNVGATLAALAGMDAPVVLIAGGQGKGQDFAPLAPAVAKRARAVVLIGEDAPVIEKALNGAVRIVRASGMSEAVNEAARLAHPGDCVLLSPACASFDMFRGYAHRGEAFTEAVKGLAP